MRATDQSKVEALVATIHTCDLLLSLKAACEEYLDKLQAAHDATEALEALYKERGQL